MSQPLVLEVVELSDLESAWKTSYLRATLTSSALGVLQRILGSSATEARTPSGRSLLVERGLLPAANAVLSKSADCTIVSDIATGGSADEKDSSLVPTLELKVLSDVREGYGVFHPPTHTLFRIDEKTASVLKDCLGDEKLEGPAASRHQVTVEEINTLFARLNQAIETRSLIVEDGEANNSLHKLVLNVSNDCNLRCRYCYAQGGHYGQPRALMSSEIACQAIDRASEYYDRIGAVMFFGGEPTLNPEAIQASCDRMLELQAQGAIAQLPSWGMVTNGLALTEHMQALLQHYELAVTVSLDGPAGINDFLRPTPARQGSFQRVARNIRRIQELTGGREPSKIEATYTAAHRAAGLVMLDLSNYFSREFGIHDVHIAPVSVDKRHDLHWTPQAGEVETLKTTVAAVIASWLTQRPRQLMSLAESLHPILTQQTSRYRCGAGLSELTIQANGDIYACYLLQTDEFRIGNVSDPDVFESERFKSLQQRLRNNTKAQLSQCRQCWARNLCRACIGMAYRESQTIDRIPDQVCMVNQAIAESALLTLAHIWEDSEKWEILCGNIGEMISANVARHLRVPHDPRSHRETIAPKSMA